MMSNFLHKLHLVVWKNFIIRRRHWVLTIFEIVIPVLIFAVLGYVRSIIPELRNQFINTTEYHNINEVPSITCNLFYAPNFSHVNSLMDKVTDKLRLIDYRGFANEEDMLSYIAAPNNNSLSSSVLLGVIFENLPKDRWPNKLKYRLRTNMDSQFSRLFPLIADPFHSYSKRYYFDDGFITAQHAIDLTFVETMSQKNLSHLKVTFQEMPYPPREVLSIISKDFLTILPVCTMLAFIFMFPSVLQRVIEEKSSGIKELMKMMGLESWMIWLGWFIHSMVANIPAIAFIVIMLKVGFDSEVTPIVEYGSGCIVGVFLILYCTSGICFCFTVSTIFKKATTGMCVGMVVWVAMFFLAYPVVTNDDPAAFRLLRNTIMLIPNACLVYGMRAISEYERKEIGVGWSNLFSTPNPYSPHPSMGAVFSMLIFDSLLLLILTWYIDNVFPGEYGNARPWYFPCMKSYWCSNKVEDEELHEQKLEERNEVEAVSADLQPGVKIRKLYKEFDGKKAVNELSFDIYSNQITVLLGHNGAGKTTTMNIITGMLAATRGSVFVDGYSVQKNINNVRKSLGLCPQHNLQFPDLTVMEHLMFFAMLKGRSRVEAQQESHEFLEQLTLSSKANKMAKELSGGMRRKLSLGMALVGHTRVLMLDEPTSGLDPEARREIWDFLLSMRGERTILITTHHMEEADILGDRIVIMHHGELMCYGTSLFLKKHYGTGYTLSFLVLPSWDVNAISDAIHAHVPTATVKNVSVGCVTFVLPTNDTAALSRLFLELEYNKNSLRITSFGVSITTMEEVFLKVGEIADETDHSISKQSDNDSGKYLLGDVASDDPQRDKIESEYMLKWHQFKALLLKRIQYTRHKWIIFLLQIMVPIVMVILILTVQGMQTGNVEPDIKRDLTLASYFKPETFYSNAPQNKNLAAFYKHAVSEQKSLAVNVPQVSDAIVNVGVENVERYHRTLIAAAELNYTKNEMVLNAMYGNWALHGPGISLNLITNALLKSQMNSDSYSISVTNNPFPTLLRVRGSNINISAIFMWLFQLPLGITIMFGFFLIFPQQERFSGVKHLQLMTGIPRALYWLANYAFDLAVYIIIGIVIVVLLVSFDAGGPFGNPLALGAFVWLIFLYGFGALPFSYLLTYRPTSSSCMNFLTWIQILFGTVATVVVSALEYLGPEYKTSRDGTKYIFYFIPNFAFSHGLYHFTSYAAEIYNWEYVDTDERRSKCRYSEHPCCRPESSECAAFYNYFDGDNSIKEDVIFLTVHIILYWAVLLFVDSGIPRKFIEQLMDMKKDKEVINSALDEDVEEEKKRVTAQMNGSAEMSDVLVVSNLRKWFRKLYAVRGLTFGVKTSECFGLLGINGAGKTTTFKMLTGDIFPSAGCAKVMGLSLKNQKCAYLKNIGYCPQFDALNFTLTTRQMLQLFAHLRGIQPDKVDRQINKWIQKFGIKQYEDMPCGQLSGGNKRKLSAAIALIGDPPLIMLDEPTSGVDPVARRNLWDILAVVRKSGQAIVLTSHSMDECEALCDRLSIMVDGQMKCIGNIQYLKKKFGQGFIVMVKLRPTVAAGDQPDSVSAVHKIKSTIEQKYTCTLKDEHSGMLLYHVTNADATLGEIFNFMENLKTSRDVLEDFAVSDTSLEQVFLSFAKQKASNLTSDESSPPTTASVV